MIVGDQTLMGGETVQALDTFLLNCITYHKKYIHNSGQLSVFVLEMGPGWAITVGELFLGSQGGFLCMSASRSPAGQMEGLGW